MCVKDSDTQWRYCNETNQNCHVKMFTIHFIAFLCICVTFYLAYFLKFHLLIFLLSSGITQKMHKNVILNLNENIRSSQ